MKIVVASVHFSAGHTAHLKAYMDLAKSCGYESALYVDRKYINLFEEIDFRILINEDELIRFKPDVIWIYNTGFENINLIKVSKKLGCKIVYVLHEPFMGVKDLIKDGSYAFKEAAASLLNTYLCLKSDKVILSSKVARENCKTYMKKAYKKSDIFPLIFSDKYIDGIDRKYFSMIGGYAESHGSSEFLSFVKNSYKNNNILFQIATRDDISDVLNDSILQEMIYTNRLLVFHGKALTEKEINMAYRRSICTWNGYKRSTQSGVLANSFMQGTPVIATRVGSFEEYIVNGENGIFIESFDFETILNSYKKIQDWLDKMTIHCRESFLDFFHFEKQREAFKKIIEEL